MEINIVAGGPDIYIPDLRKLNSKEMIWVGVDRGSLQILEVGIHLHSVFGDFDSISKDELNRVREHSEHFYEYPPEKDATDLELALEWAYKQVPDRITIYGATGGRMDHTLANIMMLADEKHMKEGIPTRIVDRNNEIRLFKPGSYVLDETEFKYISFIPITEEIEGITLVNFKYPLSNVTLYRGRTLSVSNELNFKTGTFSFLKGILLVVRSRD
ncbi:thiamine diphosphokinase [Bacillus sp. FJAT-27986]|uniref:thiamine diphosphokinase n=1 Tax=Bacillus sp. FJAT-27986 TaxID=1743146 RepID=UPI00080AD328|nr:thiamine diphosphokinase [Bacillus sp. FJAT-27986]OCA89668.1 thiamine pyrophosphokinase [Bacillus sp. FJAT-27986]